MQSYMINLYKSFINDRDMSLSDIKQFEYEFIVDEFSECTGLLIKKVKSFQLIENLFLYNLIKGYIMSELGECAEAGKVIDNKVYFEYLIKKIDNIEDAYLNKLCVCFKKSFSDVFVLKEMVDYYVEIPHNMYATKQIMLGFVDLESFLNNDVINVMLEYNEKLSIDEASAGNVLTYKKLKKFE